MFIPAGAAKCSVQCALFTHMTRLTGLMMEVVISDSDDGSDNNNFKSS